MSDAQSKISFFSKNETECPVCETRFFKEELRTGGGRLIAGNLTTEFRRKYEPSKKYGPIHPLIYTLTVCPSCYFSAFPKDFPAPDAGVRDAVYRDTSQRQESISLLFSDLDFEEPRTLKEGIASYYFAMMSYDHFPKEASPTIKRGLCALRGAWLSYDLHRSFPGDNYDYLGNILYRKARFFYTLALEYEQNGKEGMAAAGHLGPDLDKNYGYDGVLYLAAYLEYAYGPKEQPEQRIASLENARRTLARIFGMGKASKNKPTVLLESAKDLRAKIGEELESLTGDE